MKMQTYTIKGENSKQETIYFPAMKVGKIYWKYILGVRSRGLATQVAVELENELTNVIEGWLRSKEFQELPEPPDRAFPVD